MAKHLDLKVTYPAAGESFHEKDAPSDETLGALKPKVLKFFGLEEGEQGGQQITYVFFKGKDRLNDLSITLGALPAGSSRLCGKRFTPDARGRGVRHLCLTWRAAACRPEKTASGSFIAGLADAVRGVVRFFRRAGGPGSTSGRMPDATTAYAGDFCVSS